MPVEKLGKIPATFCNFFATCTKLMLKKVYFAFILGGALTKCVMQLFVIICNAILSPSLLKILQGLL